MVGKIIALAMSITVLGIPLAQRIMGALLEHVVNGYLELHILLLSVSVLILIIGFARRLFKIY
jgi:hypothetical protein